MSSTIEKERGTNIIRRPSLKDIGEDREYTPIMPCNFDPGTEID